uniref:CCHC-type domain-containing protein n=1 Tax=Peronospora matthiolae TaxID=2874970 RepID=A0AAV1UAS0_9STRA
MSRQAGDAFSAGGAKKYPKRACFFCEDEGHVATTCPLKKEFLEKKKRSMGSANVVGASLEINKTGDKELSVRIMLGSVQRHQ